MKIPNAKLWSAVLAVSLTMFGSSAGNAAGKRDIVVVQPGLQQHFDPTAAIALPSWQDYGMLFDGLFNMTEKGITPALAERWEVSDGGKQIDFELRQGVKFHDGAPFTAEDVKFTFEKLIAPDNTHSYRKSFVDALARVEVLGTHKARFVLKAPWPGFFTSSRTALISIVPKKYYEAVGAKGFQEKPVGTGPFKMVELQRGEWTKYVANDDYWGSKPQARVVTFRTVKEAFTRYAMLERGEADIILGMSGALLEKALTSKGVKIFSAKYSGSAVLLFNTATFPESKDRRVRLAVGHAIDRKRIASTILAGVCEPGTGLLTPATLGFVPGLEQISYDPALAKRLLSEANVEPGRKIVFNTMTESYGSMPNAPQVLESIAGFLEAAGFKVERKSYDIGAHLAMLRSKAQPDIFSGSSALVEDGSLTMESWFLPTSPFGGGHFNVPEYVDIFKKQLVETDPERRKRLIQEFYQLEGKNLNVVPLFWCHTPFVTGANIAKWEPALGSPYHMNLTTLTFEK